MYVFRIVPGREDAHGYIPAHRTLCEMTPAEFKAVTGPNPPEWAQRFTFRKTDGQTAHKWVADDGHHETALYMGEDRHGRRRIKYARDGF